jgi:hypothetical protein
MKRRILILGVTHLAAIAAGFAGGIYALPILIAPEAPSEADVRAAGGGALFSGRFVRELAGSDALHWGEGEVSISATTVAFQGRLAPGPDYRLYLSPEFVETEAAFEQLKPKMVRVGEIRTFENFIVQLPPGVDPGAYRAVIVWCETFRQFITAAKYR